MTGPLAGFVFLELGDDPGLAHAGSLLSLLGADVVRVRDTSASLALREGPVDPRGAERSILRLDRPAHQVASVLGTAEVSGALDADGLLSGAAFPVVRATWPADPLAAWASSGAMALTGELEGPPVAGPPGLMWGAEGAAAAVAILAALADGHRHGEVVPIDGPALLGERAAISGLGRRGRISPGGATRLLPSADGWVAMTLARPEDVDLLAAWLGHDWTGDPWRAVEASLRTLPGSAAVERAQLLGVAAAEALAPELSFGDTHAASRGQPYPPSPYMIDGRRPSAKRPAELRSIESLPRSRRARSPDLVVDLSSLWAGPLCASLLPGRVVKIEGRGRLDGARRGAPAFFDLLNARKESVVVDLRSTAGRAAAGRLLAKAGVVIDSARPRALSELGLGPEDIGEEGGGGPGWVSITGYGRSGPWMNRVAYGDDAAAAGGLAAVTGAMAGSSGPMHCADAVADPLAGVHAAVAALALLVGGGGHVVEVAMREVVGHLLEARPGHPAEMQAAVRPPRARQPEGRAPAPGAHTAQVLSELGASASPGNGGSGSREPTCC